MTLTQCCLASILILTAVFAGCSQTEAIHSAKVIEPSEQPASDSQITVQATRPSEESGVDAAKDVAEKTVEFHPPYPDRADLFEPPTRSVSAPTRQESSSNVALRGFIDVDGPRALLVIDGRMIPTQAGERYGGIDVLSIDPPQVTLQRGRIRWTEKLYQ